MLGDDECDADAGVPHRVVEDSGFGVHWPVSVRNTLRSDHVWPELTDNAGPTGTYEDYSASTSPISARKRDGALDQRP